MEIIVKEGKAGIKLNEKDGQVFVTGTWEGNDGKDYTNKSKKGNLCMAWFNQQLFDQLIEKYMEQK